MQWGLCGPVGDPLPGGAPTGVRQTGQFGPAQVQCVGGRRMAEHRLGGDAIDPKGAQAPGEWRLGPWLGVADRLQLGQHLELALQGGAESEVAKTALDVPARGGGRRG